MGAEPKPPPLHSMGWKPALPAKLSFSAGYFVTFPQGWTTLSKWEQFPSSQHHANLRATQSLPALLSPMCCEHSLISFLTKQITQMCAERAVYFSREWVYFYQLHFCLAIWEQQGYVFQFRAELAIWQQAPNGKLWQNGDSKETGFGVITSTSCGEEKPLVSPGLRMQTMKAETASWFYSLKPILKYITKDCNNSIQVKPVKSAATTHCWALGKAPQEPRIWVRDN